jgi:hypothetical protein
VEYNKYIFVSHANGSSLWFLEKRSFFMKNLKLVAMIGAAFFAAFAFILDLLPSIQLAPWMSISFAMVPIFILAFRWGVKVGLLSGFLWGLLQVVLGNAYYLAPIQFLIEYFLAFAFVGCAGLFTKRFKLISKPARRKRPYYGLSSLHWLEVWLVTFGTLWQELYSGESMRQKECHPLFIHLS